MKDAPLKMKNKDISLGFHKKETRNSMDLKEGLNEDSGLMTYEQFKQNAIEKLNAKFNARNRKPQFK